MCDCVCCKRRSRAGREAGSRRGLRWSRHTCTGTAPVTFLPLPLRHRHGATGPQGAGVPQEAEGAVVRPAGGAGAAALRAALQDPAPPLPAHHHPSAAAQGHGRGRRLPHRPVRPAAADALLGRHVRVPAGGGGRRHLHTAAGESARLLALRMCVPCAARKRAAWVAGFPGHAGGWWWCGWHGAGRGDGRCRVGLDGWAATWLRQPTLRVACSHHPPSTSGDVGPSPHPQHPRPHGLILLPSPAACRTPPPLFTSPPHTHTTTNPFRATCTCWTATRGHCCTR